MKKVLVAALLAVAVAVALPGQAKATTCGPQNVDQNGGCAQIPDPPGPPCGPQNMTQNGCAQVQNHQPGSRGPQNGYQLPLPARLAPYPPRHGYLQTVRPLRRASVYLKLVAASLE